LKVEEQITRLDSKLAELEALIAAGALSKSEGKSQLDLLQAEREILLHKKEKQRRQLEFLKPALDRFKLEIELGLD
jgi:peptidoglycan hydrolase CwlO-like protein